jgi:hypothetical protein
MTRRRCCMRSPRLAALRSTCSCTSRSSSNRARRIVRARGWLGARSCFARHRLHRRATAGSGRRIFPRLSLRHVQEVQRVRAASQSRAVFPARVRVCCALVESSKLRQALPTHPPTAGSVARGRSASRRRSVARAFAAQAPTRKFPESGTAVTLRSGRGLLLGVLCSRRGWLAGVALRSVHAAQRALVGK